MRIADNKRIGGVVRNLGLLMLLAVVASKAIASEPLTHCAPDEEVYYACTIERSNQTVSLCGQSDELDSPLWVQYRFGAVGRPELVFPSQAADSLGQFGGVQQSARATGLTIQEIWFKAGAYDYLIEHVSGGDCDGPCKETNDLVVFKGGQAVETHACGPRAINHLWKLYGHISDDQSTRP